MDIRIDPMQQVNQTSGTQKNQAPAEDFKFTLMSSWKRMAWRPDCRS